MAVVDNQRRLLSALLTTPGAVLPPSLFLYGHRSTGKRTALRLALQHFAGHVVTLDCVECYSTQLFYQLLLQRLSDAMKSADGRDNDDNSAPIGNIPNADVFVQHLREMLSESSSPSSQSPALVVVLEHAERLRGLNGGAVLRVMLQLQQLGSLNCCCVLVSSIVWDKFTTAAGLPCPLPVHFPQFTRQQLHQLLSQSDDFPRHVEHRVCDSFTGVLLFTVFVSCRDIRELRHMASSCLEHYLRPIERGLVEPDNVRALWKNVEPYLRSASRQIFMRESSVSAESEEASGKSAGDDMLSDPARLNAELPFYSKFLLIAAFLASYNPAKTDRRFFVNARQKRTKRAALRPAAASRAAREVALLAGPRAFPLHRLMAIFYFIVEDRVTPSVHLYTQLMSLVSLQLLARVTAADNIDTCKLRCLTSLQTTRTIAASVDFQLDRYLYDFV